MTSSKHVCPLIGALILALALQSVQDTYTSTSLVQIEREFGLMSSTVDSLMCAKWIGLIPGLLVFGYLGGRGDRLKYLAIGAGLAALGNLVLILPHLIRAHAPERFNMTAYEKLFIVESRLLGLNATPQEVLTIPAVAENIGKHVPDWYLDMYIDKFMEENPHLEAFVPITPEPENDGESDDLFGDIFGKKRRKRSNFRDIYPLGGRGGLPPAMFVPVSEKPKNLIIEKLKQAFKDALFKKGANATYAFRLLQEAIQAPSREPLQTSIIKAASSPFTFCNRMVNQLRASANDFRCSSHHADYIAYSLFYFGLVISSFGVSAFWCLGLALADDHLSRKAFAVVLLIVLINDQIFGAYIGGMFSTWFNLIWYNLADEAPTHMDAMDPRWIGAYWLGYLVQSALFVILTILLLIVRLMKGVHSIFANRRSALQYRKHTKSEAQCCVAGPLSYLFTVLTQPSYLLISIALLCLSTANYGSQHLQVDILNGLGMKKNSKEAMIYLAKGIVYIIGLLIGAGILFFTRGRAKTCILLAVVCLGLSAVLSSARMALSCESLVQRVWQDGGYNTTQDCNINCNCLPSSAPILVCDKDGNPFYSPCHAGCTEMERVGRITLNFSQCACAKSDVVSPSYCHDPCKSINILRYIIEGLIVLIDAIPFVPLILVLMRLVRDKLRSMALALTSIFVAVGALIAQPIYDYVINASCIHYESTCDGAQVCKFYEPRELRLSVYTLDGGIRILSAVLCSVVWVLVRGDKSVLHKHGLTSMHSGADSDEMEESTVWLNRQHIDPDKDQVDLYDSPKARTGTEDSMQNGTN